MDVMPYRLGNLLYRLLLPALTKLFSFLVIVLVAIPSPCLANPFGTSEIASKSAVIELSRMPDTLAFSPDGKQLAIAGWGGGGLDVWDLAQQKFVSHFERGGSAPWGTDAIHYSPDGRLFAVCGRKPSGVNVEIYDTSTWRMIHSISDSDEDGTGCSGITFTPNGKELVRLSQADVWASGNNIIFYDASTWEIAKRYRTYPLKFWVGAHSYQAQKSINYDKLPFVTTPDMLLTDPGNPAVAFDPSLPGALSISKDGRYLAVSGMSSVAFMHDDARTFKSLRYVIAIVDISKHALVRVIPQDAASLDWNPDSTHLAVGCDDLSCVAKVYDAITGVEVASEINGTGHVRVRYTPDGKYLIESTEKDVEIWDGAHQHLLQTIHAGLPCIAVSSDGHYLALGGSPSSIFDSLPLLSLMTHPNGPTGKVIVYELK